MAEGLYFLLLAFFVFVLIQFFNAFLVFGICEILSCFLFLFKPTNAIRGERVSFDGSFGFSPICICLLFFIFTHIVHLVVQLRNMQKRAGSVYRWDRERLTDRTRQERMVSRECGKKKGGLLLANMP